MVETNLKNQLENAIHFRPKHLRIQDDESIELYSENTVYQVKLACEPEHQNSEKKFRKRIYKIGELICLVYQFNHLCYRS